MPCTNIHEKLSCDYWGSDFTYAYLAYVDSLSIPYMAFLIIEWFSLVHFIQPSCAYTFCFQINAVNCSSKRIWD